VRTCSTGLAPSVAAARPDGAGLVKACARWAGNASANAIAPAASVIIVAVRIEFSIYVASASQRNGASEAPHSNANINSTKRSRV
jgi:hypothetical protein